MRGAALAMALLTAFLAGCSGGGKDDGPGSPLDGVDVQPVGEGKGAVAGVVVDEAIRPIAGAEVSMAGEVVATTGDDGVFVLDALDPGLAVFAVSAEGFFPIQTSADVLPGETSQVRVQLPRDARPQPYHVTYALDGFMEASTGYAQTYVEDAAATPLCDCRLVFTPEPNATTLVYEAYWEHTLPDPGGLAEYYWIVYQTEGEGGDEGYCLSPCVQQLGFGGFTPGAEVVARLDSPDTPVFQQPFKLFVTVFYHGEAPDGWTLAAQGE
jgi:hypothetical protein